jgi:hypothetical protein
MKTIKMVGGRIMELLYPLNENEISFFDVKELYDAAFAEKDKEGANAQRVAAMMTQAETLDAAYRAQLAAARPQQVYGKAA